ncbi:hypothetical protein [Pseudoalteromonas tunicata]|jgi:hypothetical protein|uniref:Zn-ribbon motif protein n=1 Tax=Pseudoalteromonas tunicata D2 TaxID=87626 RepID=A4C589_9GAMM|nr:hypothetical protein [Pseudoalteromonas tunicata]ATC96806.1 hypothetical protein PTUN_b0416 [Pseudoalteromonas tunicata]AXT32950.1 hypothetical protein D1819_19125 [Pseudoalteromonas tunicata]EAR30721.1 hypothetical protein PTD2_04091 [Pseudoalteromonas tunicata D2]
MARPNKNAPTRTVDIFCKACQAKLYKYQKGGKGALVKCFVERITQDFTINAGQCPNCQQFFARQCLIRGVPALKIIGGKVHSK